MLVPVVIARSFSVEEYSSAALILFLTGMLLTQLLLYLRSRGQAKRTIRRRREFEGILSEITSRLTDVRYDYIASEIRHGLDCLRLCLRVERASLFSRLENSNQFQLLASSFEEGAAPALSSLNAETFPWTMDQLLKGQPVFVEKVEGLPEEANAERDFLRSQAIKSFVAVPIVSDRSVVGIFILTEQRYRGWPEELVRQLQILGGIFYQAHVRQIIEGKATDVEQRFSLAVNNAPLMIWMSDANKLRTYFNQSWLGFTGRALSAELGYGWSAGVHPADLEQCMAEFSAAFDQRQKFEIEYRLRRFDGEFRTIVEYGVPRFEPKGTFSGYIGSCTDVTDARRSEQELKELSSRLIDAQENERQRIARELHDDFSQQLTLLALELAKLNAQSNRDPRIEALVMTLETRIRHLAMAMNSRAHQLHSSHLEILGLASAIQSFCRDFSEQYEIAVSFKQSGVPSHLPSNISLCLFRIVQEGLQNIAKHSHTRNCSIELGWQNGEILLRIADAGVGFDPAIHRAGIGMISMRERLRLVNGSIQVVSFPAKGTRLEVRVPFGMISASA